MTTNMAAMPDSKPGLKEGFRRQRSPCTAVFADRQTCNDARRAQRDHVQQSGKHHVWVRLPLGVGCSRFDGPARSIYRTKVVFFFECGWVSLRLGVVAAVAAVAGAALGHAYSRLQSAPITLFKASKKSLTDLEQELLRERGR